VTESGDAASFGIDIIIMASAGGVELAVGAAAVGRHDGVCAESGVIPQQGALAYGSCTQPGVQRMLALGEFPAHALCLGGLGGFCGPVFVSELAGYGSGHAVEAVFRVDHHVLADVGGELPGLLTELGSDQGRRHEGLAGHTVQTFGGQGRDRTGDLPLFRRTLIPTELPGRKASCASTATLTGLEPATSAVTGRRANQLRHRASLVLLLRVTASRTPYGIRTRATALKGRRPRPLDEGGQNRISPRYSQHGYAVSHASLGHHRPNPQTRTQYPGASRPYSSVGRATDF
jgi:hypothetical protein